MKVTADKQTDPGLHQVFHTERGDVLGLVDEDLPGEPLLGTVMRDGEVVVDLPSLDAIRARCRERVAALPAAVRRIRDPEPWPVSRSPRLVELRDRLLAEGWEVLAVDNFVTGAAENVEHLAKNAKFKLENEDVSENRALEVDGEVGYVLHFASPASPPDYLKHPIATMMVGSMGTQNALELALRKKAKFFMASTSECYGDPEISPQKEEYWGHVNSVGPRAVYDEAKRFSEAMTMAYHRHHGVDTRIVRIFNTYGPRMRLNDGRALPNFVFQALSGQALTIYGDGKQTRSFCYVDDLIDGIYKLMLSDEHLPVNIGNPQEITILEFAERIREHFDNVPEIIFEALPQDDPKRRCPDISKAKRILNWEPKINLEEGLKRTLAYFKQEFSRQQNA